MIVFENYQMFNDNTSKVYPTYPHCSINKYIYYINLQVMSRAKEIKEKEELQAKLALTFNRKRQTVLSWLGESASNEAEVQEKDKNDFLHLPVMPAGSLLNLNNTTSNRTTVDNKKEIGTIGEFLKGDRKVSTLTKRRGHSNTQNTNLNSNKHDNKATIAFKNKMRDEQRQRVRKEPKNSKKTHTAKYTVNSVDDSDSDDEVKFKREKQIKSKNMPLQFGKKHGK